MDYRGLDGIWMPTHLKVLSNKRGEQDYPRVDLDLQLRFLAEPHTAFDLHADHLWGRLHGLAADVLLMPVHSQGLQIDFMDRWLPHRHLQKHGIAQAMYFWMHVLSACLKASHTVPTLSARSGTQGAPGSDFKTNY